ncbi:peptide chain release factor N(5)-glutamine methyltransferase [Aquihabitans sp. McL0605]|uniref:peptide chain release factor N(5)-glutamine methyltransferase n=1 Tax=Aquihabitans sp. McL0605 TaxID=3415671 RepID=UPI003CEDA940
MTDEPTSPGGPDLDGTVSWRELWTETTGHLTGAGIAQASTEARWIVEEASGMEGSELVLGLDSLATVRGVAHLDHLVGRRVAGEPIQYVLGHWSFRHLDLLVDRRVLIPRPETEQVVEVALDQLDRLAITRPSGHRLTVADLGTGSGAIALAIATERPSTHVWATDRSADALAVTRANLAGLGMAGSRVRVAEGSWFGAIDPDLRGRFDAVISNPPYIAADEELHASVADWEPVAALVPGPTGLEAYEDLLAEAGAWLAPGGIVVLEIGATQGEAVCRLATSAGLVDATVHPDVAGLDRTVVARRQS